MGEDPFVVLPPMVAGQSASWQALLELADEFGEHWLLVGGQMVFLHQVERGARDVRPTNDVDVVADIRAAPGDLERLCAVMIAAGFRQEDPDPDGIAHRFRRDDAVIDLLAPDNVGKRARLTVGCGRTISVPGATQALHRTETIDVVLGERQAGVRRPNLVGALIGKAAAVDRIASQTRAERARHLFDVDSLAQLLGPTDRQTAGLTPSERKMLHGMIGRPEIAALANASLTLLVGGAST